MEPPPYIPAESSLYWCVSCGRFNDSLFHFRSKLRQVWQLIECYCSISFHGGFPARDVSLCQIDILVCCPSRYGSLGSWEWRVSKPALGSIYLTWVPIFEAKHCQLRRKRERDTFYNNPSSENASQWSSVTVHKLVVIVPVIGNVTW